MKLERKKALDSRKRLPKNGSKEKLSTGVHLSRRRVAGGNTKAMLGLRDEKADLERGKPSVGKGKS